MKSPYPNPPRIAFRPTSSLAFLVGFSALSIAAPSANPLRGQPPGEQPSTPNAPLPSPPAEDFQSHAPGAPQKPSRACVRVLVELAALGTESARLSQLATQRAAHQEVRDFAGQVTQASQALVEEIDRLAAAKNVTIRPEPAHTGPEERPAGTAFDEDYLRRTRRIHEDSIAALEEYTHSGDTDPHLITLAEQHLPGLHRHLRQAEDLDDQLARSRSPRPDDLITGEPPSATSPRHPPVIQARH